VDWVAIVDFATWMIEEAGFDGIHLDPEPVLSGNRHLLTLLRELRERLGAGPVLSVAGARIAPIPGLIPESLASPFAWSSSYYRAIATQVDEVALMTYDSAMPSPWMYRLWTHGQVLRLAQTLKGSGVRLFIGVPTSEERTFTHNPAAENITSGLMGVRDAIDYCRICAQAVTGVAIYPYWETDESEWETLNRLWANHAARDTAVLSGLYR
jgi:spore germination protein YaaH